jgi:hypothetical protein
LGETGAAGGSRQQGRTAAGAGSVRVAITSNSSSSGSVPLLAVNIVLVSSIFQWRTIFRVSIAFSVLVSSLVLTLAAVFHQQYYFQRVGGLGLGLNGVSVFSVFISL